MSNTNLRLIRLHNNKNLFVNSVQVEPILTKEAINEVKKHKLLAIKSIVGKEMTDLQDNLMIKTNEYYHLCNKIDELA